MSKEEEQFSYQNLSGGTYLKDDILVYHVTVDIQRKMNSFVSNICTVTKYHELNSNALRVEIKYKDDDYMDNSIVKEMIAKFSKVNQIE